MLLFLSRVPLLELEVPSVCIRAVILALKRNEDQSPHDWDKVQWPTYGQQDICVTRLGHTDRESI